jgi:multicomponent Na+:H+ antiporter subunit F
VITWYLGAAIVILITVIGGMIRVVRGPSSADRMIAAQLFGTSGVAWILLFSVVKEKPVYIDVALVLALLAAVTAVAFVRRAWPVVRETERDID